MAAPIGAEFLGCRHKHLVLPSIKPTLEGSKNYHCKCLDCSRLEAEQAVKTYENFNQDRVAQLEAIKKANDDFLKAYEVPGHAESLRRIQEVVHALIEKRGIIDGEPKQIGFAKEYHNHLYPGHKI